VFDLDLGTNFFQERRGQDAVSIFFTRWARFHNYWLLDLSVKLYRQENADDTDLDGIALAIRLECKKKNMAFESEIGRGGNHDFHYDSGRGKQSRFLQYWLSYRLLAIISACNTGILPFFCSQADSGLLFAYNL